MREGIKMDPEHDSKTAPQVDDDGKRKRTGNVLTATTHIITVVVGAGVLALPWAMAQLGWMGGIGVMVAFSCISIFTYNLVADCYRYPHPVSGTRNYTYMQAVKSFLGGRMHIACGIVQYSKLAGVTVGYTITTSTSLVFVASQYPFPLVFKLTQNNQVEPFTSSVLLWVCRAIRKAGCFHRNGHQAYCKFSNNPFMAAFGVLQIFLSQIPNFHELTWLSTVACITSFGYALIGSGLSLAVLLQGQGQPTSVTGVEVGSQLSGEDKMWRIFSAMGNIALACSYATVVFDIMDTLKSTPPECKQMKKANVLGITAMTALFLTSGGLGYAAFGDQTPGNILTGFGFYDPFWLVDIGNICIVIHMLGAYQIMAQAFFLIVEMGAKMMWPKSDFVHKEYPCGIGRVTFNLNMFRLVWRTAFVMIATTLAMAMPFFNEFLALLGAIGFWPLIVFFPIQMHIAQIQIKTLSLRWCALQLLSSVCFLVSLAAAVGSIHGISHNLSKYKPFMYKQ